MALAAVQRLLKPIPKPAQLFSNLKVNYRNTITVSKRHKNNVSTRGISHGYMFDDLKMFTSLKFCALQGFHGNKFHCSSVLLNSSTKLPTKGTVVQVLTEEGTDLGMMTFGELEELARQDRKRLVNIAKQKKSKKGYPTFQLLSEKLYKERRLQMKKTKPHVLEIRSKITDYDLAHKLNKVHAWIDKGCDVEIHIVKKSEDTKNISEIFKKITESVKESARVKHSTVNPANSLCAMIHLQPIPEAEATDDTKQQPLKIDDMKKKGT